MLGTEAMPWASRQYTLPKPQSQLYKPLKLPTHLCFRMADGLQLKMHSMERDNCLLVATFKNDLHSVESRELKRRTFKSARSFCMGCGHSDSHFLEGSSM